MNAARVRGRRLRAEGARHGPRQPDDRRRRRVVLLRRARHVRAASRRCAPRSATGCSCGPRTSTRRSRTTSACTSPTGRRRRRHVGRRPARLVTCVRGSATRAAAARKSRAVPCGPLMTRTLATSTPPPRPSSSAPATRQPLELVDAAITRDREAQRRAERGDPPAVRPGPHGGRGAARCPTGRSAACRSSSRTSTARSPATPYHAGNRAPAATSDYVADHDELPRSRSSAPPGFVIVGKTNTPEFGLMPTTEPEAARPDAQPVGHVAHPRRLERRLRRGGRERAWCRSPTPATAAARSASRRACAGSFGLKPSRGRVSLGPDEGEAWGGLVVRHVVDAHRARQRRRPRRARRATCPATRTPRRRRARRTSTRSAPTRAGCASALRTDAPAGHRADRSRRASPPPRTRRAARVARPHRRAGVTRRARRRRRSSSRFIDDHARVAGAGVIADAEAHARPAARPPTTSSRSRGCTSELAAGHHGAPRTSTRSHAAHAWTRRDGVVVVGRRGFDLLLTPTLAEPPPELGDVAAPPDDPLARRSPVRCPFAAYTAPFNITGQPAMSVPLYWSDQRAADRRAARRRAVPRGRADPGRRAARSRRGRGPTAGRPSTPDGAPSVTRARSVAGGQGFYGDTPTAVDALARRRRRLPVPRGAGRADARDPAEGPRSATRRAATPATSPRTSPRALPFVADGRTKVITNAGGINPAAAARAAIETARALGITGITIATVLGDDLLPAPRRARTPTAPRSRTSTPASRSPTLPGAAAVRVRVPRRAPDRRRARAGRRHRDHRPRRRRVAVPRAARARARLGVGRLGPARGRHPRRPPARVLGPEPRRQLLRRLVGAPAPVGPRRTRSPTSTPTAPRSSRSRRLGRPRQHRHPAPPAALRGARPRRATSRPTSSPTSRPRTSRISRRPRRITGVRGTPATDTYKVLLAYHAGWSGEARVAFSWPDAYEKAKATAAIFAKRVEMAGLDGRASGTSSTGASTRSAARPCRRTRAGVEPPECVLRVAWRCDDQRTAGARRPRARAAHAVGAARRADRRRAAAAGGAHRAARDLADARRQDARRPAGHA